MARCLNFGYLTCTTVRIHGCQLFLKDLYKTSTTTCLEINKPLRLYSQKIVQLKCSNELGRPLLWRSERNQGIHSRFSWRKFSTYPGSFIRRKEILILILAGKCYCLGRLFTMEELRNMAQSIIQGLS